MTKDIEDLLGRHKDMRAKRRPWEAHWQELAELMLPRRAAFTGERKEGEKRSANIYDSTPMQARRGLSAAIDGLLKPKSKSWFSIEAEDEGLNRADGNKVWLEAAEERLFKAIYEPKARFIQRSGEVDDELVTFGTGCLFIGEAGDLGRFLFRSIPLERLCVAENADGNIDTAFIRHPLTARQAEQRFGSDNLGAQTLQALKGPNAEPDKLFEFLQVIQPRGERDPRRGDSQNLPIADLMVDVDSRHLVGEAGFHEFPLAVPRWDTATGEIYGRSPAMIALGDSLTLQAQAETLLKAGQKQVDPPLLVGDDAVLGDIHTYPGGISYFDMEAARDLGGRPPVMPLNSGADIPLGREMQQDCRDQIWAAFFRNVLGLPVDAAKMTATEVLERKDEFIRTIGPVFGRLEADYIAAVVERAFNIMLRAGGFSEPPAALIGGQVHFRFVSPIEQARRQIEAAGMARSFELLAPLAAAQPDILDNFDGDEIARATPDIFVMPKRWLRPKEKVAAMRSERARAAEAQSLLEGAKTLTEVAGKAAAVGAAEGL